MPRFCSVAHDGAHIRYLDSGGDDLGAPIVFVPGFTDVADDYIETLPAFGRRAAVVELRGHGHSRAVAGPYDSDTLGRDVGAVIDAVTDGPVHLITFSRGTAYALTWALAHQARVRSLSIGDYVLSGGEVAAMVVLEAVGRLVPGVMGNATSADEESFSDGLLEYPHFTKPASFRGWDVPEVLRSGDHGRIARWRRAHALRRTLDLRPDLVAARGGLTDEERRLLDQHGLAEPAP